MNKKNKELLFIDISGRLTYGVKVYIKNWSKIDRKYYEGVYTVESAYPSLNTVLAYSDKFSVEVIVGYDDYEIKPYLIPMDMMTEDQKTELNDTLIQLELKAINNEIEHHKVAEFEIDFYNKNMFDYRGLIEKGLALDASYLNIYNNDTER
jgi:hypothetical protein